MRLLLIKINDQLAKLELAWLILLITALVIILTAQVVLRYLFNSPLFWAEEIAVQIMITVTFFGVSYLIYSTRLVKVDLIINHLKPLFQRWLIFLLQLIGLIVLSILCYVSTDWILQPEIKGDISPTTGIPRWYNYGLLIISFYLMAWHQLVNLITHSDVFHKGNTSIKAVNVSERGGCE